MNDTRCGLLSVVLGMMMATGLRAQEQVDIGSQLRHLMDVGELPVYRPDTEVWQVSSYDREGGNDDGFDGTYSFLKRNPDSTLVLFDVMGKGCIDRIWTPTPTRDTLDFYFDGAKRPDFSIPFEDLFSGQVAPFKAPLAGHEVGGYYSYLPIPFRKGCKIVFRGKEIKFHQIQYRLFPKSARVTTFGPDSWEKAMPQMDTLAQVWMDVPAGIKPDRIIRTDMLLAPGKAISLADMGTGGRILGIEIDETSFAGEHDKMVDIRIQWDDEEVPAVYMPAADFFGYAYGEPSMQSLLLGYKEGMHYSYFPMPFDKAAKIELIYRQGETSETYGAIPIKARVLVGDGPRKKGKEGRFYARWNREPRVPEGKPHVFLKGEGHGHYVGTILQAQGLDPGMTIFFEGDDIAYVDGEMRLHGTGSEDYFNGGWYALLNRWDQKTSLPLHGALEYSIPYSRTGGYRLFLSDKIPFDHTLDYSIEHGPEGNTTPVDYTSVALYYADAPLGSPQQVPTNALTGIYTPETFTLYPQLIRYAINGKVTLEGSRISAKGPAQVLIDLSELPKGNYKVYADLEKEANGMEVSIWQRQRQVGEVVSFRADGPKEEEKVYMANIRITDQLKNLTVRMTPEDGYTDMVVYRWIFEKQ